MLIYVISRLNKIIGSVHRNIKFCSTVQSEMSNPVVTIKEGKLRGSIQKLCGGVPYYSFKGIPYAQAPVGKLRFKAPLPVKPWEGIREAVEHGPVCPQLDIITLQLLEGSEDCLFLNVYSKSLTPSSKLPVMVFIHGGAFMSGSGDSTLYGPEFLLQHDIVLVTINYRLEVLGFLCLDTPEVPGNAGMKDQVAALCWVKRNIAQFGGDPDNITLFGESAGAASVTYHLMSPMSTGLFHKAIAQSGVCITDWASGKRPIERAFSVAKILGKEFNDSTKLLDFLQSVPATDFLRMNMKTATKAEKHRSLPIHFAPVVEKKFDNVDSFLNEEPLEIILSNKFSNPVPLITGYTSSEGILTLINLTKKLDFLNKYPFYRVPHEVAERIIEDKEIEFGQRIKRFYNGDRDFTEDDLQSICDMESDLHFIYNIYRFAHYYSKCKPMYMYRFDYETELNLMKQMMGFSHLKGVCHADELFYLFSSIMTKNTYEGNEQLKNIVFKVTKLWTNFAKTGNPTPDNSLGIVWKPYERSSRNYLNVDEELSMAQNDVRERLEFWNKLYKEAGLPYISKSNL